MQDEATQLAPERYVLDVTIPGLPKMFNALGRNSHWPTTRNTQIWKANVLAAVGRFLPAEPLKRAKVTFTRCSSVKPDPDNARQAMKPVLDGLVSCGVLEDDSSEYVGEPIYNWEYTSPNKGFIHIRVEEIAG